MDRPLTRQAPIGRVGTRDVVQAGEQAMQAGTMEMAGEPNTVDVPAGTTMTLTWQFTEAGTTQFACHQPGHFAACMFGDVTVTQ